MGTSNRDVSKPAKIALVVEDDAPLRELLVRLLRRNHYEVLEAQDGIEALDVFESRPVDVIVTDYFMPRMDGGALVRKIKKDHPDFPAVLVTGEAPDAVILGFLGVPRVITMIKPFESKALLDAVGRVLSDDIVARTSTRVSIQVPCRVYHEGASDGADTATLRDISFTGALVEISPRSQHATRELEEIEILFQGLERFPIRAKVRRILPSEDGQPGSVGISFEDQDAETSLFLRKFVLNKMKRLGVGIA
jgi:CheY-like chemotaxis protein